MKLATLTVPIIALSGWLIFFKDKSCYLPDGLSVAQPILERNECLNNGGEW
jgi:hypothetical protein